MRAMLVVVAAGMLGAAAGPAAAQMVDAARPQSVVTAIQEAGYRAALETAKSGKPLIRSAANGSGFTVLFDDCDAQNRNCRSLVFVSWYKPKPGWTIERLNKFQDEKKFLRVYFDKDGDMVADYWITTLGGLPDANFKDALDWFVVMSGQLLTFLDGGD